MKKHEWDVPGVAFVLGVFGPYGIGATLILSPYFWPGEFFCLLALVIIGIRYGTKLTATIRNRAGRLPTSEALLITVIMAAALWFPLQSIYDHLTEIDPTVLVAADDPNPPAPTGCTAPAGAVSVYFGSNVALATSSPFNLFATREGPLITVVKDSDRPWAILWLLKLFDEHADRPRATLSLLKLFDEHGDVLVHLEQNKPWVTPSSRVERPDHHTLVVYNRSDKEVLRIRYINPSTFILTGIFWIPGAAVVTVTDAAMAIQAANPKPLTLQSVCMHAGIGAFLFNVTGAAPADGPRR